MTHDGEVKIRRVELWSRLEFDQVVAFKPEGEMALILFEGDISDLSEWWAINKKDRGVIIAMSQNLWDDFNSEVSVVGVH